MISLKITVKTKIITKLSLLAVLLGAAFAVMLFMKNALPLTEAPPVTQTTVPQIELRTVMYCETEQRLEEVTNADLLMYSPRFSSINTRTYFKNLGETEQLIYSAFEYAFENCRTSFYINRELFEECSYNDVEIFIFLSLDHPLVEQNFEITTSEPPEDISDFKPSEYMHFDIPSFSRNLFEQKLQALGAAQAAVASLPGGLTDGEKALELYKKLCSSCEYISYSSSDEPVCYVYDALVSGKSHCDGFSNAYSLLLNLAGIPCAEKACYDEPAQKTHFTVLGETESTTEYYKTPTGHTWATFKVNGKWYNADPSYDSSDRLEKRSVKNLYLSFGVPDGFCEQFLQYDYSAAAPAACNEFLIKPDCEFKTVDDENIEKTIYGALSSSEKGYVILTFDSAETADLRRLAERLCNYADISVYYGRCNSTPVITYFALREKD